MRKLKKEAIDPYILAALKEDMNAGDLSTQAVIGDELAEVDLFAKEEGILAGLDVYVRVFTLLDPDMEMEGAFKDGDRVKNKDKILTLRGKAQALLSGERVALNFLQRMSSIATYTRTMVDRLGNDKIKVLDTRKTTPNMRIFEKYAVTQGGGYNHRYNLSDGIMLKDNHIGASGGLKKAVEKVGLIDPFIHKIEVEVESLDMVKEALDAKVDIIMLDNMDLDQIREATKLINKQALIEVSGNISLDNVHLYKDLDIDYISSGSITYDASCLDLSMKGFRLI